MGTVARRRSPPGARPPAEALLRPLQARARARLGSPASAASTSAYSLTSAEREALVGVAQRLGADPAALAAVIAFESGWKPTARNSRSGATGLIQFMPSTAARLGTSTDAIAGMSRVEQLALVERYLRPYAGRLGTVQAVAMAVFYPKAMAWTPSTPFPSNVQAANPGIRTVADYMARVARRAGALSMIAPTSSAPTRPSWFLAALAGVAGLVGVVALALLRRHRARVLALRPVLA